MDTLSIYYFSSVDGRCYIRIRGSEIDSSEVNECLRILSARGCKRVSIIVVGSDRIAKALDSLRGVIKGCITLSLAVWLARDDDGANELEDVDLGELYA